MIALDEALQVVLERTPPLPVEFTGLAEAAGAWLAEPVASDADNPPADVSAMDGFALRAADLTDGREVLDVIGEVAAGVNPQIHVGAGQAARIMTGAVVPPGADAVQIVEHTEPVDGGERVRILRPAAPGSHIRRRGENLRRDERLLEVGCRLGAAEIGLLATVGRDRVAVRRRPRVALVPTGDELVEPAESPGPAQIRNSNGPTLLAQVAGEGAAADYLGIARDEAGALDRLVRSGLERDVLILSGGVSMGVYDLVTGVLRNAGVEILFERVAIKPGKPTVFGCSGGGEGTTLVFGLPGNPVSAMLAFRLLVAPALRRMRGASRVVDQRVRARLSGSLRSTSRREAFHPARIAWTETGYRADPLPHRGSGDLVAWRAANGVICLPADVGAEDGEPVEVLLDRDHDLR